MVYVIIVLSLSGVYILTSLLLLRFPHILHKKKIIKFKCRHISHMGGAGENTENSMKAFQSAYDAGTDMLELDCHLTKDQQVVVCHDDHLLRTTGCDLYISETDFQDLPPLQSSIPMESDPSIVIHGEPTYIPLLREVFQRFPDVPVNIDLKMEDDLLVSKVGRMICEEFDRENLTVWGGETFEVKQKCIGYNPRISLMTCRRSIKFIVYSFFVGLLPFLPIDEDFYEIPMPSVFLKTGSLGFGNKLYYYFLDFMLMNKVVIRHLQRRGVQVFLWVLNEEEEFERGFKYGADGLMTDFPTKLKKFIVDHPE